MYFELKSLNLQIKILEYEKIKSHPIVHCALCIMH